MTKRVVRRVSVSHEKFTTFSYDRHPRTLLDPRSTTVTSHKSSLSVVASPICDVTIRAVRRRNFAAASESKSLKNTKNQAKLKQSKENYSAAPLVGKLFDFFLFIFNFSFFLAPAIILFIYFC